MGAACGSARAQEEQSPRLWTYGRTSDRHLTPKQ